MQLLSQIQSGKQVTPRRTFLYGVQGVGKSTFGAMYPSPIFLPTEEGLNDIECDKLPLAKRFDDVMTALGELYEHDHSYQTLVVDSLDWLEKLIWSEVCAKRNVTSLEDIPYAKGYVFALTHWREFLEGLDALRRDRNMTIVLIAHAKIERFENPETEPYDRYVPRLHKNAAAVLQEWCDEVLFATYKVYTKSTDQGFDRTRTQGIGSGERVLRTAERPAHVAKNRLALPDELPLEYREYAKYLPQPQPSGYQGAETTAHGSPDLKLVQ
jgi:hypothetical protein